MRSRSSCAVGDRTDELVLMSMGACGTEWDAGDASPASEHRRVGVCSESSSSHSRRFITSVTRSCFLAFARNVCSVHLPSLVLTDPFQRTCTHRRCSYSEELSHSDPASLNNPPAP